MCSTRHLKKQLLLLLSLLLLFTSHQLQAIIIVIFWTVPDVELRPNHCPPKSVVELSRKSDQAQKLSALEPSLSPVVA